MIIDYIAWAISLSFMVFVGVPLFGSIFTSTFSGYLSDFKAGLISISVILITSSVILTVIWAIIRVIN